MAKATKRAKALPPRKEAKREPAGKPGMKATKSKPAFGRFKKKDK